MYQSASYWRFSFIWQYVCYCTSYHGDSPQWNLHMKVKFRRDRLLHTFRISKRFFLSSPFPKGFCYQCLIQKGFYLQIEFELPWISTHCHKCVSPDLLSVADQSCGKQEELLVRPVLRFVTGVSCEYGWISRYALQECLVCIITVVFISKCKLIAYHGRKLCNEVLENINI